MRKERRAEGGRRRSGAGGRGKGEGGGGSGVRKREEKDLELGGGIAFVESLKLPRVVGMRRLHRPQPRMLWVHPHPHDRVVRSVIRKRKEWLQ